ncbi:MAG: hypothetical protein ACRDPE_23455 [Solirubrobacterales bacterium]
MRNPTFAKRTALKPAKVRPITNERRYLSSPVAYVAKEGENRDLKEHEQIRGISGERGRAAQLEEKVRLEEQRKRQKERAERLRAAKWMSEHGERGGTGVVKGPGAHYET